MPFGLIILISKLAPIIVFIIIATPTVLSIICFIVSMVLFKKNSSRAKQGQKPRIVLPILLLIAQFFLLFPLFSYLIFNLLKHFNILLFI
ncbi:MAG: hypothetical protein AB1Z23_12815 [Eubacteriales bacterium]